MSNGDYKVNFINKHEVEGLILILETIREYYPYVLWVDFLGWCYD